MVTRPPCKLFVLELTVFVIQRICEHRVGEHVFLTDFTHDFHEDFLEINEVFDVVDSEFAIRELYTTEQGLKIWPVKDGYIGKGRLVNSQERLIQAVDKLLELLTCIVVRVLHAVASVHIFLPEVPCPD